MHARLLILFIFLSWQLYAQTPRTDSIKKVLSSLDERSQVNALNKLGWEYYYYWVHSDSALKYKNALYAQPQNFEMAGKWNPTKYNIYKDNSSNKQFVTLSEFVKR